MEETTTHPHASGGCFFCEVVSPQIEAFLDHVWPEPAKEHFRNARVEMLKGMRSLLDTRIARLSERGQKGTKVTVE